MKKFEWRTPLAYTWRRGAVTCALAPAIAWAVHQLGALSPVPGDEPQIVRTADVRITVDGDIPHLEPILAASPTDPNLLLAGATAWVPGGEGHDRAYVSLDGGATWRMSELPGVREHGSGDPMVGFTRTGAMHFITLHKGPVKTAEFRSVDSGRTWEGPATFEFMDRETLAIDQTGGARAGRLYVIGAGPQVFYSVDDGRTYVEGASPPEHPRACNWLSVTLNGTLIASCWYWVNDVTKIDLAKPFTMQQGIMVSHDGGLTFGEFRPNVQRTLIHATVANRRLPRGAVLRGGDVSQQSYCVVDGTMSQYHDRVYCIVPRLDIATVTDHLYIITSDDEGRTWTTPRAIDAGTPKYAAQAMSALAVNRDGVVGVFWMDTRASSKRDRCDPYFAASRDGGKTFLPPVRLSSESSFPMNPGNLVASLGATLKASAGSDADENAMIYSPAVWREMGGDYVGIDADANGNFHPIWPDARRGGWQIYTTTVTVLAGGQSAVKSLPSIADRQRVQLKERITLSVEASSVGEGGTEMTYWVRLRNVSQDTLYGPFAVEVHTGAASSAKEDTITSAVPVNASARLRNRGGRWDVVNATGTLNVLPPGAVTEARAFRFRSAEPRYFPARLITRVTGYMRRDH